MFGYIKPFKPEMKMREFDIYKGIYCSLCKHMGKKFGALSRLTLSYDCTFLALVLMAIQGSCSGFKDSRCAVNPLKKCMVCNDQNDIFEFSGAVSIIMSYYKIMDDINDNMGISKLRAYALLPIISRPYRKAKKLHPEIDSIVNRYINSQSEIERTSENGVDVSAEPTSHMMSELLVTPSFCESQERVIKQFGYFIGRWIYLIDASDDLEKDIKNNNFNPFVNLLIKNSESNMSISEINTYCNEVLNQTLSQAISAYNLLEIKQFNSIIENILYLGLPQIQKSILFDQGGRT